VCDQFNNCRTATVDIIVDPSPDTEDDDFTTKINEEIDLELFTNDNDIPTDGYVSISMPEKGSILVSDPNGTPNDPSDDVYTYIPHDGESGYDCFEYTVCDSDDNCSTSKIKVFIEVVDASLVKMTKDQGPFQFGQDVEFIFELTNEGNIDLYNVKVNDFLPCGYKYLPINNNVWDFDFVNEIASTLVAGPVKPDETVYIPIILELSPCFKEDSWMNVGEIGIIENEEGEDISDLDIDSEIDEILDNESVDEDDYDNEDLVIYDLALINELESEAPFGLGDIVDFKITIVNQGNTAVKNVLITDYLPVGFIFRSDLNEQWEESITSPNQLSYLFEENLEPGQSVQIRLRVEIDFIDFLQEHYVNVAEISGAEGLESGQVYYDSDSTPDNDPTNDGIAIDNELQNKDDEDDHDPATFDILSDFIIPCNLDCVVECYGQVNVSLNQDCESEIVASMVGVGIEFYCNDYYTVTIIDETGSELPSNVVDISHVGRELTFELTDPMCGNKCWGDLNVEYKLPPQIECPSDLTISCGGLEVLGLPPATAACGGLDFTVVLESELREALGCDNDEFTHRITRTYLAADELGNEKRCTHTVMLERVNLDSLMFPEHRTKSNGNPISCSDDTYIFNEDGFPLPWLYSSKTGSGSGFVGTGTTGVPFISDPNITNGVFSPSTGFDSGAPLIPMGGATGINFEDGTPYIIPGEANQICNTMITYSDIVMFNDGCFKQLIREWNVMEWWCNDEMMQPGMQVIEVIDDVAPEFDCPSNITVSTNDDCAGSVDLPSVLATDDCGNELTYKIDFSNGVIFTNGGVAELAVGANIVTYYVSDKCENSSSCEMIVTVRDATEPVTVCEKNTVVSISNTGSRIVYAEAFDDGSWDECGLSGFAVARMDTTCNALDTIYDESVSFCCADIGTTVMVGFRAYDTGGNYNECWVSVEVQDKDIPLLDCPADVTIDCRQPYDLENLGLVFGDEIVTDNCAEQQIVSEIVETDLNSCGLGQIVRRFEIRNPGGTSVLRKCTQIITIEDQDPFNEDNDDILWPDDINLSDVCDFEFTPQELIDVYLVPDSLAYPVIVGDSDCALIGWDYEDNIVFTPDGLGECVIIERSWTVIDWCGQGENGLFNTWTNEDDPQIIRVYTKDELEFDDTVSDTIVIESFNIDCESGRIEIERTADGACRDLNYNYTVYNTLDEIVMEADTNVYVDTLVNGEYVIEWTVVDACGHVDFDTQRLIVINTKAPIPVCRSGMSVELAGTDPVELWTEDFDGSSYHPCDNPISLSFSPDSIVQNIEFDCEDANELVTIQLWVRDTVTGVQDYCTSTILVTDENNLCPDMNMVDVSGEVYTEILENIEGVQVDLDGSELGYMTDSSGSYVFSDMPIGGNYTVVPKKDGDDLNGVSTLDLILIQRHILGIQKLNSPYKLIAADIDKNGKISALDLIELRKLILGVYPSFPTNESWRFVDAAADFVDPQNPWAFSIAESYEIWSLDKDMDIDFVGVKIGDVNNTSIPSSNYGSEVDESQRPLELSFPGFVADKGDVLSIDVTAENYNGITGWQGTLNFTEDDFEIIGIRAAALDIDAARDVNWQMVQDGQISISYADETEKVLDKSDVLFTIDIRAKNNINGHTSFTMGSQLTRAEAYRGLQTVIPLKARDLELGDLAIRSVKPNPWIDYAEIDFELPVSDFVSFEFYDVSGALLHSAQKYFDSGDHSYTVRKSDLQSSGLIYVRIITSYSKTEYKMMVLE